MKKYAESVTKIINNNYEGFSASVVEIIKMNDEKLIGVSLIKEGEKYASMNYIDEYTESEMSAETFAKEIVDKLISLGKPELAKEENITWEEIKDCIGMRLINMEYNTEYLKDKIYRKLDNGLAIIFDVVKGDSRATITEAFAEKVGCDYTMLVCAAQASKVVEPILNDLGETLFFDDPKNYLKSEEPVKSPMLVLKTSDSWYGASAIYMLGVAEKIKELIGEYYLLPSSVHEWVIVPESVGTPIKELARTVEEANRTVVARRELLSYGVYKWTENGLNKVA